MTGAWDWCCGRVSEYLPTRGDIQGECHKLRGEQGHVEMSDDQEKLWRQQEDQLAAASAEDEWGE